MALGNLIGLLKDKKIKSVAPEKKEIKPHYIEREYRLAGVNFYKKNIERLRVVNDTWKIKKSELPDEYIGRKIFHYNFINRPVKLYEEPTNEHDENAIQVYIAGELVGYIYSTENVDLKRLLSNSSIKFISSSISGGEYKVVSKNRDVVKLEYDYSIKIRIGMSTTLDVE